MKKMSKSRITKKGLQRGFIKLSKHTLISYLIVSTVLVGSGIIFLFNPFGGGIKEAEAAWFNDNWAYRKAINVTITSTATDRTDVDTLLTIDTNLGSTKLQSLCQDLRFTSTSGKILPYYIPDTTSCNSNATNKIWVRADLVPKSTTTYTMYMYYGNPSATAGSDATTMSLYNGLQGYWKLNESSGNASDNSVNPNTLTNNNTTTYTAGQFANAASFASASSQSESIADGSQTGLEGMSAMTIALWVNPTTLANGSHMVIKDNSNSQCSYSLSYDSGGSINFNSCVNGFYGSGVDNVQSAGSMVATSTWQHIVVTSENGIARLYKNGVEQTSSEFPFSGGNSSVFNSTSAFSIGGGTTNASTSYMNGKLDDVRVYNRVLTAAEISKLYAGPGGTPYLDNASTKFTASLASEEAAPSPTMYWKFDDAQGSTAQD